MEREDAMTTGARRRVCAAVMTGADGRRSDRVRTGRRRHDRRPTSSSRTAKGPRVRLADFRGKVVLLEIWASWCPDCKVLFPAADRLYREFKAQGRRGHRRQCR